MALIEIKKEEFELLRSLGGEMMSSCIDPHQGWFTDYVRAHKKAHAVLRKIMSRSGASLGTRHEVRRLS